MWGGLLGRLWVIWGQLAPGGVALHRRRRLIDPFDGQLWVTCRGGIRTGAEDGLVSRGDDEPLGRARKAPNPALAKMYS
ncbi:hypothetical protein BGZ63DRAFT_395521 [Mariannaea sp. PMI_226]|nr:hypothetical protein BGZ63DRAFT_395521 [Mariannaea sp. PMI_226]